jgi:hypothetical protein
LIALSRQVGASAYFGKGLNLYSNVHIDDLVDLYLLVVKKIAWRLVLLRRERMQLLQRDRRDDQPIP